MLYILKVGSVTNAQRAKAVLNSRGFNAYITRIANPSAVDGCGYAVQVRCSKPESVIRYLSNEGITVTGVDTE